MMEFHVGRNVVREALAQLQQEGQIERIQGMGTFVTVHKTRHALRNGGLCASVADPMAKMETILTGQYRSQLSALPASRLGLPVGAACLIINVTTTIEDEPMIATTSFLPESPWLEKLVALLSVGRWRGDWYEILMRAGMAEYERELVLEAVVADELVAGDLDIEVGEPVMFIERRLLAPDGTPEEYGFAHCRGNRLYYAYAEGHTGRMR
jgi:GntR family transcriptional regulator